MKHDPSSPFRVAYVIKSMIVGGSQTHLTQVLRFLDRSRFDPVLVCLSGEGVLLENVRRLDVPVLTPRPGASFKGMGLVAHAGALAGEFRRRRIDIAHAYLLRANLVGSVAARLARVPLVLCSKRGCHERRGFELISAKIGNALADLVPVNAVAVREFVHANEGVPPEKMPVIPSGIDCERFRPGSSADAKARLGIPADRLAVGTVTRMRVRKGVEEFLRAIARLRESVPEAHAVMAGELPVDDSMHELLRSLRLEDHVTFLGRRDDMPQVYPAFDVFVLASQDEGMSNALLEAMAAERAVVATDVGGTGEVVRHGESGVLVPGRDPEALARALADVLSAPARRTEMGRIGRRIVEEKFSAQSMVRQMEKMYLDLAARRGLL